MLDRMSALLWENESRDSALWIFAFALSFLLILVWKLWVLSLVRPSFKCFFLFALFLLQFNTSLTHCLHCFYNLKSWFYNIALICNMVLLKNVCGT